MSGVRAVIFDAVGTLIHPDPPAPFRYAEVGRRFGSRRDAADIDQRFLTAFRREEAIDRTSGYRTSEVRELRRWRDIVAYVLDDVRDPEACFQELFAWFAHPQAWRLAPDAADVLAQLAGRQLRLGIASNYDHRLYHVIKGMDGLRPASGMVVISAEVGWRKPARGFFEALRSAAGVEAGETLYVGDDVVNDYQGAREAGMSALLYDPRGRHGDAGAEFVGSLSEVVEFLDRGCC